MLYFSLENLIDHDEFTHTRIDDIDPTCMLPKWCFECLKDQDYDDKLNMTILRYYSYCTHQLFKDER